MSKIDIIPTDHQEEDTDKVTSSRCYRLHNINTLKQELDSTNAYENTSTDEETVVNSLSNGFISLLLMLRNVKTNFPRCIGYLSFTKDRMKLDSLQTLAASHNNQTVLFINFLPHCCQISCH